MTLSDVFYEAACLESELDDEGEPSCYVVQGVHKEAMKDYSELAAYPRCSEYACGACFEDAASSLKWKLRDFRTFMLLMASEAVKC